MWKPFDPTDGDARERLARALEDAARWVRELEPGEVVIDYEDTVDAVDVGRCGWRESIPINRRPKLRAFVIKW